MDPIRQNRRHPPSPSTRKAKSNMASQSSRTVMALRLPGVVVPRTPELLTPLSSPDSVLPSEPLPFCAFSFSFTPPRPLTYTRSMQPSSTPWAQSWLPGTRI